MIACFFDVGYRGSDRCLLSGIGGLVPKKVSMLLEIVFSMGVSVACRDIGVFVMHECLCNGPCEVFDASL